MRKIIKSLFNKIGLELKRTRVYVHAPDPTADPMYKGLVNLKNLNLEINSIVDVGAAVGSWSLMAEKFWPEANFLLFEPLTERTEELKTLVKEKDNFEYLPYAAGESPSEIEFYVADDLDGSGIAAGVSNAKNIRKVAVTSIDLEISKQQLKGPYLIKLDTHGYEVPIIAGCKENMGSIAAFIIECYGFQVAKDSLLFWEMCGHMQVRGFRLFQIVEAYNRQKDNAFWQCDAFFIPADNQVFNSNTYL